MTVKGFLLTLLVAAGVLSAATNVWLATHRTIVIELPQVSCTPSKTYT